MSCICTLENSIDLGCFDYCSNINTGLLAETDGIHKIDINYLGSNIHLELDLEEDDEIILEFDKNESYTYTFILTKPTNETQCYQFKTRYSV